MLRRKIEQELDNWKRTADHNPLVIKGCRQCGKTFSVRKFAEENYKNVIYINFFENADYKSIFSETGDIDSLTMAISVFPELKPVFVPHETVVILDEIQECPNARTSLKFWKTDGRYDVIATGSLLGVKGYGQSPVSIPVGYETVITMFPLDFEEFLWANGISEEVIHTIKQAFAAKIPVTEPLHSRMRELLLQYTIVGGMPAIVNRFVESKNLSEILGMQRTIVSEYREDMIKYAAPQDKPCITDCFD